MTSPLEADVGITEFVSTLPGFNSILKHRFRDFQVREVDPKGNVAALTSLEPPVVKPAVEVADGSCSPATHGPVSGFDPAQLPAARPQLVASFAALAGQENGALLDELLRRVMKMYGIKDNDAEGGADRLVGGYEGAEPWPAATQGQEEAAEVKSPPTAEIATEMKEEQADGVDSSQRKPSAAAESEAAATAGAAPTDTVAAAPAGGASGQPAAAAGPAAGELRSGDHAGAAVIAGCGVAPERSSVLLLPMASKDVRKSVHEFFRVTPGLPPLRTETVTATPQQPQQLQQQDAQEEGSGSGGKRSRPEEGAEGRPAKWQRGGARRHGGDGGGSRDSESNGGRGRGRGRGGGGGGGGHGGGGRAGAGAGGCGAALDFQQTLSRIEIVFEPGDLPGEGHQREGGGGRATDGGRGRGRGGRGRGRGRGGDWGGGRPPFVRFVLYKENLDTQVALTTVGRLLGITGGNCFGFAGTKDKRGVTCQFATAFKVCPSRLAALNTRLRGIRVGSFSFCSEGLRLGCLAGNEFQLLMRDVRPPEVLEGPRAGTDGATPPAAASGASGGGAEGDGALIARVTAACEAVARRGFINYFGLQRFGSGGAPTHEVGRALLRGEYERAVHLVLTGRADERPDIAAARRLYFEQGDAKGALRGIPPFMLGERAVLGALVRHGAGAWSAALLAVPRTLRMMYLHAWQSAVWNSAASHRIRTYGCDRVVAGDLVMPRAAATAAGGGGGEGELLLDGGDGGDGGESADDVLEEGGAEGAAPDSPAATATTSAARRLSLVRLVTEEDVAVGRYSIFDVVLPLPGTEVQYPAHETGAWIRQAATEAGVDLDSPAAASTANRELSFASLSGDYRYVLHRPSGFTFAFRRYSNPHDDSLLSTDLERLTDDRGAGSQLAPPPPPAAAPSAPPGQSPHPAAAVVSGSGPLLALVLRFQLPSSCYATMLLRELTKTSTSKAFHAGLSAAALPAAPATDAATGDGGGAGGGGGGGGEPSVAERVEGDEDAAAAGTASGNQNAAAATAPAGATVEPAVDDDAAAATGDLGTAAAEGTDCAMQDAGTS